MPGLPGAQPVAEPLGNWTTTVTPLVALVHAPEARAGRGADENRCAEAREISGDARTQRHLPR